MKKAVLVFLAIFFLCLANIAIASGDNSSGAKVIFYYFRGQFRSPACRHLQSFCTELIEGSFKDAIASGSLEFKVVTLGDNGQGYYERYYKVYARNIIISLEKGGKQLKWKKLDRVDEYANDWDGLGAYIKNEVSLLLAEAGR